MQVRESWRLPSDGSIFKWFISTHMRAEGCFMWMQVCISHCLRAYKVRNFLTHACVLRASLLTFPVLELQNLHLLCFVINYIGNYSGRIEVSTVQAVAKTGHLGNS